MYGDYLKHIIPSERDLLVGCLPLIGLILAIGGAIGGFIVWLCMR